MLWEQFGFLCGRMSNQTKEIVAIKTINLEEAEDEIDDIQKEIQGKRRAIDDADMCMAIGIIIITIIIIIRALFLKERVSGTEMRLCLALGYASVSVHAVLGQMNCPYVTRYYGSYLRRHELWIVMEYMGGGSCLDLVRA
jgi:serine/threonine protein kinase